MFVYVYRDQVFTIFEDKYLITGDIWEKSKLCIRKRNLCTKIDDKEKELSMSTNDKLAKSSYGLLSQFCRKIASGNTNIV